jgi:hypothetical protein
LPTDKDSYKGFNIQETEHPYQKIKITNCPKTISKSSCLHLIGHVSSKLLITIRYVYFIKSKYIILKVGFILLEEIVGLV